MSFVEDLQAIRDEQQTPLSEETAAALNARMEALTMALEHLFVGVGGGTKARDAFIVHLESRARDADDGSARQTALRAEVDRWKGRQT